MYKNIVFDVDGTLINTEQSIIKGLQTVLRKETGQSYSSEALEFVLGIPGIYSIKKFSLDNYEAALESWEANMKASSHLNTVYDGIFKIIDALKSMNIKLGIVTSRRDSECQDDPLFNALKPHFDFIVTADRTDKHKPSGDPLLYFLENTSSSPNETLYIGDTSYDSACAQNAHVDFMLAGWGAKNHKTIPNKDILLHPYDLLKYAAR